jgi:anthranilate phosphoribosyltransferase
MSRADDFTDTGGLHSDLRSPLAPPLQDHSTSYRDDALRTTLRVLADGSPIDPALVGAAFDAVMHGDATSGQIGALLIGLRARGETPEILASVVQAMRRAMIAVAAEGREDLVDTCGTGGGSVPTFNVSTVAAFVAAGAGVRIAKHGNRSYTSRSGSADMLEALGVPLAMPAAALSHVLADAGIMFMFAPVMHPAMRHVGPVRRELGFPTLMNLVGPLANPAGTTRQVIGVGDPAHLTLVARALAALGTTHALVVHGQPGMDEISPIGLTSITEVRGGEERSWTLDPREFQLAGGRQSDLRGGEPAENASMAIDLLSGGGTTAARSAVILNAAAAIYVAGRAPTFDAAVDQARASLERRAGLGALERLRAAVARHGLL